MPDGRLQWIDESKGVAHLVRNGREFIAPISEVETQARVPGARVHFDIDRKGGVDAASAVTLRSGTRSNHRQRRFGDLTGARQPGSKTKSTSAALGVDVTTQPYRVAQALVAAHADGDYDGVASLYAPDATIHTDDGPTQGRKRVAAFVRNNAPRQFDESEVTLHGNDECVDIIWPVGTSFGVGEPCIDEARSRVCIDHGHITEHWDRVEPDEDVTRADFELVRVIDQNVPQAGRDYVDKQFEAFCTRLGKAPLFGRVKLDVLDKASRELPINASATFDTGGRLLRAHVGAATVTEAVDALIERLVGQLERVTNERNSPVGRPPEPGSWRRGNQPTVRPGYYDRPVEERELVRHKSYAADQITLEEALWDMGILDYDFFLFNELETGADCLLDHTDTGLVLHRLASDTPPDIEVDPALGIEVDTDRPLTMSVRAAIARLDADVDPHIFFQNERTTRGNVVYRRFDGHYGLITLDG